MNVTAQCYDEQQGMEGARIYEWMLEQNGVPPMERLELVTMLTQEDQ